jgi:hypothetical protein
MWEISKVGLSSLTLSALAAVAAYFCGEYFLQAPMFIGR